MKWRLVVYEKGKKAALECYDAGCLTRNRLRPIKASLDFNTPKGSAVINVKNVGHGRKTGENLAE
jgi:hypothetical protein